MMLKAFLKKHPKVAFLFLAIVAILHSHVYAEEVIKIGGAGSTLGSMKLLTAAFEKAHPGVKVFVLPSLGSIGGIKAVSKGAIDIGLVGRPLNAEEHKLGLSVIEYAKTPLVFVTREDIGSSNITTQEIIRIFKGEMQTWPNGERIRTILRQPTESNAITVREISLEISKAMDIAMSRPWRVVALTDQETADLVEKTPGALSFCTLTQIVSEKRHMTILSYNGIPPIVNNLVNKDYPVSKNHAMVIKAKPSPLVKQFIDFVKSPEGKKILEKTGNVQI
jgi:phosphate transport system substrate-binding protein